MIILLTQYDADGLGKSTRSPCRFGMSVFGTRHTRAALRDRLLASLRREAILSWGMVLAGEAPREFQIHRHRPSHRRDGVLRRRRTRSRPAASLDGAIPHRYAGGPQRPAADGRPCRTGRALEPPARRRRNPPEDTRCTRRKPS